MAYAPCAAQHKDAVQVTLEQIDLIKRLVEAYPNQLALVKTSDGELLFEFPDDDLHEKFLNRSFYIVLSLLLL